MMNKDMKMIESSYVRFTGKPEYCVKKCRKYHALGYSIIRSHKFPDGTEVYVMEYTGKK